MLATEPLGTSAATAFARHLTEHAGRYWSDLAGRPVTVRLVGRQGRATTTLYRFRVAGGGSWRDVLVKAYGPSPPALVDALPLRPGMGTPFRTSIDALEYRALRDIERLFGGGADDRFSVVRALDHLADRRAIVLEYRTDPTLRDLLLRSARPRPPAGELVPAFAGAGAWLAAYHGALVAEDETRRPDRASLVDALGVYGDHLVVDSRAGARLRRLVDEAADAMASALPAELPMAAMHGDFAPRNVFVDAASRVAVIDAHPRWRVPVYEDVARLLVNVRLTGAQVLTRGLAFRRALLDRCEEAFLAGYFGADPPVAAVKAYELLVLLDRWAAWAARGRRAGRLVADRQFLAEAEATMAALR